MSQLRKVIDELAHDRSRILTKVLVGTSLLVTAWWYC
jgi:hypothetical protein